MATTRNHTQYLTYWIHKISSTIAKIILAHNKNKVSPSNLISTSSLSLEVNYAMLKYYQMMVRIMEIVPKLYLHDIHPFCNQLRPN